MGTSTVGWLALTSATNTLLSALKSWEGLMGLVRKAANSTRSSARTSSRPPSEVSINNGMSLPALVLRILSANSTPSIFRHMHVENGRIEILIGREPF